MSPVGFPHFRFIYHNDNGKREGPTPGQNRHPLMQVGNKLMADLLVNGLSWSTTESFANCWDNHCVWNSHCYDHPATRKRLLCNSTKTLSSATEFTNWKSEFLMRGYGVNATRFCQSTLGIAGKQTQIRRFVTPFASSQAIIQFFYFLARTLTQQKPNTFCRLGETTDTNNSKQNKSLLSASSPHCYYTQRACLLPLGFDMDGLFR